MGKCAQDGFDARAPDRRRGADRGPDTRRALVATPRPAVRGSDDQFPVGVMTHWAWWSLNEALKQVPVYAKRFSPRMGARKFLGPFREPFPVRGHDFDASSDFAWCLKRAPSFGLFHLLEHSTLRTHDRRTAEAKTLEHGQSKPFPKRRRARAERRCVRTCQVGWFKHSVKADAIGHLRSNVLRPIGRRT